MAKRFKFRLETVLKDRKRLEEKRLQEWNLARAILNQMIEAKVEMQDKLKQSVVDATDLVEKPTTSVGNLSVMEQYIAGLKIRIQRKTNEIERGEKLTEKKRLEYVLASQKAKSIEKLKEHQLEDYKDLNAKLELKKLDDTYIMRAALKRNENDEDLA